MNSETCEVPIMLDLEGMNYEDIAKLNPFYEEYKTFWDVPRDTSECSFCSDGLSSSSSLPSLGSGSNLSSLPFDAATSPSFRIKNHEDSLHPESPNVTFHGGGHCKPTYDECHDHESSQIAILDDDGIKRPLSTLRECTELQESDVVPLDDPVERALGWTRSSHKQLFGANGWLGCTADVPLKNKPKHKSFIPKGLGKKLKQHVEEIAVDMAKAHPIPFYAHRQPKVLPKSTVAISLDPTAQAKLYSEMEVMICVSANKFLLDQYQVGRVSKESIKKVNNFWGSKNRPEVVEFQYDQATQRQLILSNIRTLQFNGESSTNPVLLHSNLQNWKAVVKEMSVRTFCAPDSVIRKHMHDIQKLLDMLGAPIGTFLAFEELQMRTLAFLKEQRARNYLAEGGRRMSSITSLSSH
ncbi:uncharacterized protein BJX67DRAFT_380273 [Aspergillus lucknowensis]|uniref:Uncharacterized protein n=1 Tax=Aspergillus lucknowensis TaxID=176173 RepID=A0ABR4LU42_9EURO